MQSASLPMCGRCMKLLSKKPLFFTQVNANLSSESYKLNKEKTHYEILGLQKDASPVDIRAAFVQLSKEIHPDKNHGNPSNHIKFVALNEAYTILSKPSSRREYDHNLMAPVYQPQNRPPPGTSPNGASAQQQQPYWDDSIFHMRDRSKYHDAHYGSDNYYGIKGVRRKSNGHVAALCLGIVGIGCLIFIGAFKFSHGKMRRMLDERDKRSLAYLNEARSRARLHGNRAQIERFRLSVEEAENKNKFDRSSTK